MDGLIGKYKYQKIDGWMYREAKVLERTASLCL